MIRYKLILLIYLLNLLGYADFPARIPLKKPVFNISPAVERLYDEWNPHEDRENELYSNFKYSPIEGLERSKTISRRDPSKVILIDGIYHVWYTCRKTAGVPAGKKATEKIPLLIGIYVISGMQPVVTGGIGWRILYLLLLD